VRIARFSVSRLGFEAAPSDREYRRW